MLLGRLLSPLGVVGLWREGGSSKLLEKRELGGILICTGADATGRCDHRVYALGKCYNLAAGFYRSSKTFAPDGEGFYCFPYLIPCGAVCRAPSASGCTLGAVTFAWEHKYNLSAIGWDRYISSFDCWVRGASGGGGGDREEEEVEGEEGEGTFGSG